MTDLMDERLSAAARRWQAEQPAPPGVPLDRLHPARGRKAGSRQVPWRPVAAVAAVALAAVVTVALARTGGGASIGPADSNSSPTVHGLRVPQPVPWRDLKARHPMVGHREHGRLVTPFDNVLAAGEIHGHVHPGDVLRFTVFLESPTNVSLDPCPDYTVAFGATRARSWQLNCVQVPFRESSRRAHHHVSPGPGVTRLDPRLWHPVLPARTKVPFRMQVRVPDVLGRQKVLWTLVGPTTMPGFYGIVHVTPG